ncbi:hypothetical protein Tco_0879453, partial [Tanacetum coccineum]
MSTSKHQRKQSLKLGQKNSKSTIQYGPVPVNADMQTNQKGLGLRNNHRSRFRLNTPVKFNIEIRVEYLTYNQHTVTITIEFKGKLVGRKSSRRINFTTPHHEGEYEIQPNAFVGISKDYIDHGDPRFECSSCGAMLWFAEKNRGASNTNIDSYSICCMRGKVKLDVDIMEPPKLLKDLITKQHPKSASFLDNIRRYNSMFAFTSLGGTQDTSVNSGRGPYCYRLHGENKHRIGDLLPEEGKPPKFCQLYIYDTDNEIRNRMQAVSNGPSTSSSNNELDYQLTTDIRDMLDSNNPLVSKFRMVGERIRSSDDPNLKLRLIGTRARDGRDHNLPTAFEVAALIVGDFDSTKDKRDIILHRQNGNVKRISELHVLYLALQYPLFFPYAEDGYRTDVYHQGVTVYDEKNKRTRVTMREWFAYRLQDRRNQFSMILNGRRLLQQFIVNGYTMVEAERMSFIRKQQKDLRSETYSKLESLAQDPESGVTLRGKKFVLPSSFTGSPRYMMQNYLDAMTVCKFYGYPDLFITFTCNPNWPEIVREMSKKGLKPEDRPDVITRVFKIKLDNLIKEFKDERTFGRVRGVVYTIEFQKRGLPHCHILLWLEEEDKLNTPSQIDQYISAEIPDKEEDPELYQIVTDHMMHGPCGHENPSCPCTVDFKCTKKFPKQFNESTFIDESGYAIYRRRNDGNSIKKSGSDLHNGYVVPYNPGLLRRYQSHINVEWCNQIGSIKYLFKYINKGPDRVTVAVDGEEVDEVQDYYDCRYLSACEAAWRIYGFDIHYRTPSVERLPFHLENEQSVIFDVTNSIDYALGKSSVNETKFKVWMELNKTDSFAQTLLYVEIPKFYTWNQQDRIWQPRQREACYARGLLEDDKEYIDGIFEAREWGMGDYLCSFFVMLLMTDSMSRPDVVWQKTWHVMAEDVLSVERKKNNNPGLELSDTQRMNICLAYIEHMLLCNNKSLKSIPGMPYPNQEYTMDGYNRLIYDELSYNQDELREQHQRLFVSLTEEQKHMSSETRDRKPRQPSALYATQSACQNSDYTQAVFQSIGTDQYRVSSDESRETKLRRSDRLNRFTNKYFGGKVVDSDSLSNLILQCEVTDTSTTLTAQRDRSLILHRMSVLVTQWSTGRTAITLQKDVNFNFYLSLANVRLRSTLFDVVRILGGGRQIGGWETECEHDELKEINVVLSNGGTPAIHNALFGSKIFINRDLPEIAAFRTRVQERDGYDANQVKIELFSPEVKVVTVAEFFYRSVKKMVDGIRECEPDSHCIVYATIHRIHKEHGWAYTACKSCNKRVDIITHANRKPTFVCEDHGNVQAASRFKVIVRLIDESGSAPVVFFNNNFVKLSKYTAWELMEKHGMDPDDYFPDDLDDIVGKKALFKVYFSEYNVNHNNHTYRCDAFSEDVEFIKHFKKDFLGDEVDDQVADAATDE